LLDKIIAIGIGIGPFIKGQNMGIKSALMCHQNELTALEFFIKAFVLISTLDFFHCGYSLKGVV